ncbi:MAG: phosphopantothenoylcysteine decarboxylase [Planctomycetota bacterium]|nr:phosphopantothenoylcysteine decarboxylase [Planctomycetota bacterium]
MSQQVVLGLTAGIAIYKIPRLVSLLVQNGFEVDVIMTDDAKRFVSPLVFSTLSKRMVYTDMFDEKTPQPLHIRLATDCSALFIAPATANTIAKIALGIADNLLTAVALALPPKTPRLVAPSMDENMFLNPATQANLKTLQERGWKVIQPESGRLATGKVGKGRMPEPEALFDCLLSALRKKIRS